MLRKIHPFPINVPQDLTDLNRQDFPKYALNNIPGQAAAIRFFDPESKKDYEVMVGILSHREVRAWMDDAGKISYRDYRDWAGKETKDSFLFAVHDARLLVEKELKKIRGFVNIYSERGEKFRVKRLIKKGILKQGNAKTRFLEASMALRPLKKGEISGSGLMSSGLRLSCLQVRALLKYPPENELVIFGFVDPENIPSKRAMEAAGFVKKGKTKYDLNSDEESVVYVLSWKKLLKKVKTTWTKLKVITEPQKTDSHCGPAVIKSLLGINRIKVTQDKIVEAARVKSNLMAYGMLPAELNRAVVKLAPKFRFWYKENATSKDLEILIHKLNLPVGINWQGLFYNSVKDEKRLSTIQDHGHYSVVIDFNFKTNKIVIDDPYSEYFKFPRTFSYKWFKTRWKDADERKNRKSGITYTLKTKRLLFVVVPKNFKMPVGLKMEKGEKLAELMKSSRTSDNVGQIVVNEINKEKI